MNQRGLVNRGGPPWKGVHVIRKKRNMKQTQTIPETFLGVGYTRDRAGLPLEAVRVPVPQPVADQVLIRVAASSLNHVSQTIDSTVEAINAGLQSLKAGRGILGKTAVIVDRDL